MMLTSHAPFMLSYFVLSLISSFSPLCFHFSSLYNRFATLSSMLALPLYYPLMFRALSIYLQRGSRTSLNGNCTLSNTCPVKCSVYYSVYCCTPFSSLDAATNDVTGVTEDNDAVANGLPQHRATAASASIHRIYLPHPNSR